jgi:hypothetical protein
VLFAAPPQNLTTMPDAHACGADRLIARSKGSMWASIEPEPS